VCNDGLVCSTSYGNVGCCGPTQTKCIVPSNCLDYGASTRGSCKSTGSATICWYGSSSLSVALVCVSADPTFSFHSSLLTSPYCNFMTYNDITTYQSFVTCGTLAAAAPLYNVGTTPKYTSTGPRSTSTSPTPGPTDLPSPSSPPVGAIVGGVVGGVAVLALGIAAFALWRRNKRKREREEAAANYPRDAMSGVPTLAVPVPGARNKISKRLTRSIFGPPPAYNAYSPYGDPSPYGTAASPAEMPAEQQASSPVEMPAPVPAPAVFHGADGQGRAQI
jgi:hypothetical protein